MYGGQLRFLGLFYILFTNNAVNLPGNQNISLPTAKGKLIIKDDTCKKNFPLRQQKLYTEIMVHILKFIKLCYW